MDSIPGVGVSLRSTEFPAEEILARLRRATPPVVARIERDEVILDVRTLQRGQDRLILEAVQIFSTC